MTMIIIMVIIEVIIIIAPYTSTLSYESPEQAVYIINRKNFQTMRTAVRNATFVSSTKTEKEFLDYFKQEDIGVE